MGNMLDRELVKLNEGMLKLSRLCEKNIKDVHSLIENVNEETINMIEINTEEIMVLQRNLENLCLRLLLQQQPFATDLRIISSAIKILGDLKKIGMQSLDVANIIKDDIESYIEHRSHIEEMAKLTADMVLMAIQSYLDKDIELAKKVIKFDDKIDKLFVELKETVIEYIRKNEGKVEFGLNLFMVSKYFERIGDHCVHLSKWVIYSVTGSR